MHNNGWFSTKRDAIQYMELAGTDAPRGGRYDDPYEYRWTHVMIEEVSEGPLNETKIVASYKAKWDADTGVHSVKLDKPPFNITKSCNFSRI